MNAPDQSEIRDSLVYQPVDFRAEIASLRLMGAEKFDPLHFHYLQVLVHRADAHQESVKRILDGKLRQALTNFKTRFEHAQRLALDTVDHLSQQHPDAADDLQRLVQSGDFKGVAQNVASLEKSAHGASLGDLVRRLTQQSPDNLQASLVGNVGLRPELKTARFFRNTWSKLSVDKRVTEALAQAPKNAGPINSHNLVLRSLALMREVSPDYLNRFTSYVDTLLCLEQSDPKKQATVNQPTDGETSKKKTSRRGALKPS